MNVSTDGFTPNAQIDWKLITSNNKTPTYGYFSANSTGGFNDSVFVGDLKDGHYKMYFGTDANADGKLDITSPIAYANISMPCSKQ